MVESGLEGWEELDVLKRLEQRQLHSERHVGALALVSVTGLDAWYNWPFLQWGSTDSSRSRQ